MPLLLLVLGIFSWNAQAQWTSAQDVLQKNNTFRISTGVFYWDAKAASGYENLVALTTTVENRSEDLGEAIKNGNEYKDVVKLFPALQNAVKALRDAFAAAHATAPSVKMADDWTSVDRTFRDLVRAMGITPADQDPFLGTIAYSGGFIGDLKLNLPAGRTLRSFQVAIPQFCTGVEVLRASVISQGIQTNAQLADASKWIFSLGKMQAVDAIVLSLNGPAGAQCTIPVYAKTSVTPPPVPGNVLRLCNAVGVPLWTSLGYQTTSGWVSEGWWKLYSGECAIPKTTSGLKGDVYVHAFSDDGRTWGTEYRFCVTTASFLSDATECVNGTAGYQWAMFSKVTTTSAAGTNFTFTP